MIDRDHVKKRDGSIIQGIPVGLLTFIEKFQKDIFQIKIIPDDQNKKKQFIIAAVFEYIFFYVSKNNRIPAFYSHLNAIKNYSSYFADIINRIPDEGMQLLDESFNTDDFEAGSVAWVNHIFDFNYQDEGDFDNRLFACLYQYLGFSAILFTKDSQRVYGDPNNQICLIIYSQNNKYFITYPEIKCDWNSIINYNPMPWENNSIAGWTIRLECLCTESLPASGMNLWKKIMELINRCPKCNATTESIDIEIIKKKKKELFTNKCFYCRENQSHKDQIFDESIDYSFCKSCIGRERANIINDIWTIAKIEKLNPEKLVSQIESYIREKFFTCYCCQISNDRTDSFTFNFSSLGSQTFCRDGVKRLIYQPESFSHKILEELWQDLKNIQVIKREKEFLGLFCIKCDMAFVSKENMPIMDHEICVQKYCQKCFREKDVGLCDFCGKIFINIYNKTPYDNCEGCNLSFPKAFIVDSQCLICKKNNRMDIVDETRANLPVKNIDPKLIQSSHKGSDEMPDLQTGIQTAKEKLKFQLNCEKIDENSIELSPELPDDYLIYRGKHLKFSIELANGYPINIKATPINENSTFHHLNFSKEGLLSPNYIDQNMKGQDIYSVLLSLFGILKNPLEEFWINDYALKLWNDPNGHDKYEKMLRRFITTAGLESS